MLVFSTEITWLKSQELEKIATTTIASAYRNADVGAVLHPLVRDCIPILSRYANQSIMNDKQNKRGGDVISLAQSIGEHLRRQPLNAVDPETLAVRTLQDVYSEQTAHAIHHLITETGISFPDSHIRTLADYAKEIITREVNIFTLSAVYPIDLAKGIVWGSVNGWPHNTLGDLQRDGTNYTVQQFNRRILFSDQERIRDEITSEFYRLYTDAMVTSAGHIAYWPALLTYTEGLLLRTGGSVPIDPAPLARGLMELAIVSPSALQLKMDEMPLSEAHNMVAKLQVIGNKLVQYYDEKKQRENMLEILPPYYRTIRSEMVIQRMVEEGMKNRNALNALQAILVDECAGIVPYSSNVTTLLGSVKSRLEPLPRQTATPLLMPASAAPIYLPRNSLPIQQWQREAIVTNYCMLFQQAGFRPGVQVTYWQALLTYTDRLLSKIGETVVMHTEYMARGLMELAIKSPSALQHNIAEMPVSEAQKIVAKLQADGEKLARYSHDKVKREAMLTMLPASYHSVRTEAVIEMMVKERMTEHANVLRGVLEAERNGSEPYAPDITALFNKVKNRLQPPLSPPGNVVVRLHAGESGGAPVPVGNVTQRSRGVPVSASQSFNIGTTRA